ncbi:ABC-2 type transport system permease protein [Stackebrandtia albiflava]|uniref:ABC-2 type transport system permease protein n=1 Tax=Stackebrandtia albiflava TaxID=406432 RepID=A0A562UR54_9ACTN|nr:ABC transporter permease [Stackebrandtia albiflava]TWJ08099.1 ABC-2 type transport system permease protein [Stackebrandtia albiflava]
MKGVWLVAKREILTRGLSRSYIVGVVVSAVLVAGLTLLPGLLGGPSEYRVVLTGTESAELATAIEAAAEGFEEFSVETAEVADPEAARAEVEAGDADAAIIDNTTLVTESGADQQLAVVIDGAHQAVTTQRQLAEAGFDPADVNAALTVAPLQDDQLGGDDAGARQGIAYFLVIVLFFMVMMPTMYVAMGVVEEKSSRIVEILLSSLKPWQLLVGKVAGLGVLGFVNLAVPLAVGLAMGDVTGAVAELPSGLTGTILSSLVWWVLGFCFYAAMAGALASMISRQEDMNSAIGPLTMLMILSYVVAAVYAWQPTTLVARVLSYVPPFSMFMMPVRDAVNDAPLWQQGLSALLMALAAVGMFALGATIYRRSVMRTGSKVKLTEVLRKSS